MALMLILLIPIILTVIVCKIYNDLVRSKNYVQESWSQIDVQLIRRSDLIPNIVEVAKGYAKHEQETLEKVISARNQLVSMGQNGSDKDEIMKQSDMLSTSLKSIFALTESYPELKSNQNFLRVHEELTTTENKIAYARQLYNSSVVSYNTKRQLFPGVIIANMFGFKEEKTLIEAVEEQREAVKVEF